MKRSLFIYLFIHSLQKFVQLLPHCNQQNWKVCVGFTKKRQLLVLPSLQIMSATHAQSWEYINSNVVKWRIFSPSIFLGKKHSGARLSVHEILDSANMES